MFILVAGAATVFAAPIASAHETKLHTTPAVHSVAKSTKAHSKKVGKSAKHVKSTPTKVVTPTPPLYIYVPGYNGPPIASDQTDACLGSIVNCTDEQLCEDWGENCDTVGSQPAAVQSAPDQSARSGQLPAPSPGV
jgi:hypothetical protein